MCDLPKCNEESVLTYMGIRVCETHEDMNERGEINLRDIAVSEGLAEGVYNESGVLIGARAKGA